MNKEILEEKVYYYTDVIEDPKKLLEAIETDNANEWGEWAACSGQHYIYGTNKTIEPSSEDNNEKDNYIYNTLKKAFDDVARDYAKAQGIPGEPKLFPQYPIKKYSAGTFMGAHFDQQEGDERLKVSFVMYLNDDYDGGEISFTIASPDGVLQHSSPDPDFAKAKEGSNYTFAVKPKAGSVIVFPPSPPYHHTAHLVKSGFKYMIPQHWIH
jgi:hypothetical protein